MARAAALEAVLGARGGRLVPHPPIAIARTTARRLPLAGTIGRGSGVLLMRLDDVFLPGNDSRPWHSRFQPRFLQAMKLIIEARDD